MDTNDLRAFASVVITHMDDIRVRFEANPNNDLAAMLVGSYCRSGRVIAFVADEDRRVAREYLYSACTAIGKHDGSIEFAIRSAMDRYDSWPWEMDIEDCSTHEQAINIIDVLDEAWEMTQTAEDLADWKHCTKNERFNSFKRRISECCSMICKDQERFATAANWASLIAQTIESESRSPLRWVGNSLRKHCEAVKWPSLSERQLAALRTSSQPTAAGSTIGRLWVFL